MYNCWQGLKSVLAEKIPEFQKEVADFRKQYGDTKVGEITVNMVSLKTNAS